MPLSRNGLSALVAAFSAIGVALLFYLYLRTNYVAPIAGDMWAHTVRVMTEPANIIDYWLEAYTTANPRIGQALLANIGASTTSLILIQFLCLALLVAVSTTLVLGPSGRTRPLWLWPFTAFVFLSLLTIGTRYLGQVLFYPPRTTNYVFGYALLLIWLLPYAVYLRGSRTPRRPALLTAAMVPIGLLAGLSNEHTVPAHVAGMGILLLLGQLRRRAAWPAWVYSGYAALVAGYLLLFFAPGQDRRYDGSKFEAFSHGIIGLLRRIIDSLSDFFEDSWRLWLILAVLYLVFLLLRQADRRPDRKSGNHHLIVFYLVGTALVMAATVGASPLLKPSLFFASAVNLALASCLMTLVVADYHRQWREPTMVVALVAASIFSIVFWKDAMHIYGRLHLQFVERQRIVDKAKAGGLLEVTFPAYVIKGFPPKYSERYYRLDGLSANPRDKNNRYASKYYGVDSVKVLKDEKHTSSRPRERRH